MAHVLDVAKYVSNKCAPMTAMKLEKVVYYCQAWSLAWDDVPLFDEEFQAWANGPVCPELFAQHRGKYVIDENFFASRADYDFTASQIETMDKVIEYYGSKEPHWLSELTHKENPWREARKGTPEGYPSNAVITKESMMEYYGGLSA